MMSFGMRMSTYYSLSLLITLSLIFSSNNNNGSCHAFIPSSTTSSVTRSSTTFEKEKGALYAREALATDGDWNAYLDEETTGLIYYFNTKNGESVWLPPTDTFPSIQLSPELKSKAKTLQKEYQKSKNEQEEEAAAEAAAVAAAAVTEEDTTTKEESSFFGNLFRNRDEKKNDEELEQKKKEQETIVSSENTNNQRKGGLFSMFGGDKANEGAAMIETTTDDSSSISIDMSAYVLPHPAKVRWGGEDAVFCKGRTFGVFDGVSGAEKLDGIPLYSVTLAQEMKETIGQEAISLSEITKQLTDAAEFADNSATGASTAVVGSLADNGAFNVLNVGDSLCMVVRNDAVLTRTKDIVHYFDCPYQLSEDSPDRPRDGTKLSVRVQKGDTILMGSDGVFDNLDDTAVCKIVKEQGSQTRAAVLARKVVEASRRVSLDPTANTPYAVFAKKDGDPEYEDGVGGKVDDVSCIVVRCS